MMPTISMTNCNDTPSRGPLTADDIERMHEARREYPCGEAPRIPREREASPYGFALLGLGAASAVFAAYWLARLLAWVVQ